MFTPHAGAEQVSDDVPEQYAPPFRGVGLLQVRTLLPVVPQAVAEQVPYALHPPFVGVGVCV